MQFQFHGARWHLPLALAAAAACSDAVQHEGLELGSAQRALTADERLAACGDDPRVRAGLVSAEICAGADIFLRETFGGNGRTCGSCHPVANNTTIDTAFIAALPENDPLFVFESVPALANLETSDLRSAGAILENVDGFEDPVNKFVSRSVPHLLSLSTSLERDPADPAASTPGDRAGWGGDGVPDSDGSFEAFLEGAVGQHFPKTLGRAEGADFRAPTELEVELTSKFQRSLGRLEDIDLAKVVMVDPEAELGRQVFLNPNQGRCNVCHRNAGANFQDTGLNRNFDTGVDDVSPELPRLTRGSFGDIELEDGGFGGQGLAEPNVDSNGGGFPNAFGNVTFSPPPLVEAADTGPFFHSNARGPEIERAVNFYATATFATSPANLALDERFGPRVFDAVEAAQVSRFLRALNAAFNVDLATQRLEGATTLAAAFGNTGSDVQKRLLELAAAELQDALDVLTGNGDLDLDAIQSITGARAEIAAALGVATAPERVTRVSTALEQLQQASTRFGSNLEFVLGTGNLMF